MAVRQMINSVDKKLVLAIIAVLIGVAGLYATFSEPKARISFVAVNETNVLDVHEELEDLTILFRGKAIQEERLNLRILTLRVENSGQVNVLQSHYDRDDIWGIEVRNGEIIEARLVDSNSAYVQSNLSPQLTGTGNIVEFRKIIFEKEDYFMIEVLVLHERDETPEVIPIGKISGIGEMEVVKYQAQEGERGFIGQLVEGSALVHFIRSISYLLIFSGGVGAIVGLSLGISALVKSKKRGSRRKRINKLISIGMVKVEDMHKAVVDMYVEEGLGLLREIKQLLENKTRLGQAIRNYRRLSVMGADAWDREGRVSMHASVKEDVSPSRIRRVLTPVGVVHLVERGLVRMGRQNQVVVDIEFEESLNKVLPHLEAEEALELTLSKGDK